MEQIVVTMISALSPSALPVVFRKSDVGKIMSTVMIVMGLQSWSEGDTKFHADDMFQVSTIHTDLTLFKW